MTSYVGVEDIAFHETHVPALTEVLAGYSSKWNEIATSLWLPSNEIENIAAMLSKPVLKLKEVLLIWVRCENEHTKAPTFAVLKKALRSEVVGCGAKANSLEKDLAKQGITFACEPACEGDPEDVTVEEDCENFKISNELPEMVATEGNVVLLEVQISGNFKGKCKWYRKVNGTLMNLFSIKSFSNDGEYILCVSVDDLTVEGSYICEVQGKFKTLQSEPILLSVITPLDQHSSVLFYHYCEQPEVPEDT